MACNGLLFALAQRQKGMEQLDVVFEIVPANNSTKINFTHIGLQPQVECYNDCVKGWDQYVKGSLLELITKGKGQPS